MQDKPEAIRFLEAHAHQERLKSAAWWKHWLLWRALPLTLATLVCGLTIWLTTTGPMEKACKRIHRGMTLKEVEGILGESSSGPLFGFERWGEWKGEDGSVEIDFATQVDEKGGVFRPVVRQAKFFPTNRTWSLARIRHRFRSWLGL
jgi:hypothetical protein